MTPPRGVLWLLLSLGVGGATVRHAVRCNPKDDVCHDCDRICSTRRGDHKVTLNTACKAECEVALYNCDEGNPTASKKLDTCVENALQSVIEAHGDLSIKIMYDVPPSFRELDELEQEDGCIRKADMEVLVDILDGSMEGGHSMPTAKASVWSMWSKADTNKDGCVNQKEFDAAQMGGEFEEDMPTPHHENPIKTAKKAIKRAPRKVAEDYEAAADDVAEDSPVYIPYASEEPLPESGTAPATEAEAAPAPEAEVAPAEEPAAESGAEGIIPSGEDMAEDVADASPVYIPYLSGDDPAPVVETTSSDELAGAGEDLAEGVAGAGGDLADGVAGAGDDLAEDTVEASPVAIPYAEGADDESAPAEAAPAAEAEGASVEDAPTAAEPAPAAEAEPAPAAGAEPAPAAEPAAAEGSVA